MCVNFLKNYKDEIASAAAILSSIAILFGVWQFYLARQAVQAQAIGSSLSHGRELYDDLDAQPDLAVKLFGSKREGLSENLMVTKILSFFSEQQIYFDGWLIDGATWKAVKNDMCNIYRAKEFKALADPLLDAGNFPSNFVDTMREC